MMCPKCVKQLLKKKYVSAANLNVDYCPRCKGVWLDQGELDQAMSLADRQLQVPRNAVRLVAPCPRCAKPLYAFPYPQTRVAIEMCKKCGGLWLDTDEIKQIREARRQLPDAPEESDEAEDASGVKGALIRFIDSAIEFLMY